MGIPSLLPSRGMSSGFRTSLTTVGFTRFNLNGLNLEPS